MKTWVKLALLTLAGGSLGFAYYYFIGCVTGSCPITSNPYISTGYGALIAALVGISGKKEPKSN